MPFFLCSLCKFQFLDTLGNRIKEEKKVVLASVAVPILSQLHWVRKLQVKQYLEQNKTKPKEKPTCSAITDISA